MPNAINFPPESEDQLALLNETLCIEEHLSSDHRKWVAWSAALACRDEQVIKLVQDKTGTLNDSELTAVEYAVSRMAVTNPYFFSRNFFELNAGGTLQELQLRPFHSLNVSDETAYHYACIAVSMINGGYVCFRSHLASLKQLGESDAAIDQALRLTAAISAARQVAFNQRVLPQLEN